MEERDDYTLFTAITQQRDREAFAELVNRHRDRAFNVARRIVFDSETAEDVVQEAMIAVWTWSKPVRTDTTNIAALIMSIVVGKARTHRRSKRRRSTRENTAMVRRKPHTDPVHSEEADLLAALRNQIDQLPELESQILTYCYGAGMSHRQVAELLDVSRQTVTVKINKVLEGLRGSLLKAGAPAALPLLTEQHLCTAITSGYKCPPGLTDKILSRIQPESLGGQNGGSKRTKKPRRKSSSNLLTIAGILMAALAVWLATRPANTPKPPPVVAAPIVPAVPIVPVAPTAPVTPLQDEIVYEDDFKGKVLSPFWEKRNPPNQFQLDSHAGLILFAAGSELVVSGQGVSPSSEIVSQLIELNDRPIEIRSTAMEGTFVNTDSTNRQLVIEFGGRRSGFVVNLLKEGKEITSNAVVDVEVLDEAGSTVYRSRIDSQKQTSTIRVGQQDLPPLHPGAGGRVLIAPDGRVAVRARDSQRYLLAGTLSEPIKSIRIRRSIKVLDAESISAQPLSSLLVKRLARWPGEIVDIDKNAR